MNMSFFEIMLCYRFYLEAVLQDVAKNNSTKKEFDAEIRVTLKHITACFNSQKRTCKVNCCKLQREILIIDCNYKLQLLPSECQKQPPEFCEKGVLKSFAKFTEKHLCQSLFFNKVADLRQLY